MLQSLKAMAMANGPIGVIGTENWDREDACYDSLFTISVSLNVASCLP
jgi:hypothetical protein